MERKTTKSPLKSIEGKWSGSKTLFRGIIKNNQNMFLSFLKLCKRKRKNKKPWQMKKKNFITFFPLIPFANCFAHYSEGRFWNTSFLNSDLCDVTGGTDIPLTLCNHNCSHFLPFQMAQLVALCRYVESRHHFSPNMTTSATGWNVRPLAARVGTRVAINYNTNHYTDRMKGHLGFDTLKLTSRRVIHLPNRDGFHSTAPRKQFIIVGWLIYFSLQFFHYAPLPSPWCPCVFFPTRTAVSWEPPPLPLLASIIKSSLPPLPPLHANSSRCSSSGPVSSC